MDTLNDLLAASDLVMLHCSLSDETVHLLNAESLQNIKPGNLNRKSSFLDICFLHIVFLINLSHCCSYPLRFHSKNEFACPQGHSLSIQVAVS